MDVPRVSRRRSRRRWAIVAVCSASFALFAWAFIARPSVPVVRRDDVVTDTVIRGDVPLLVRASGTLVPEHMHFLTAQASARVERLFRDAGATVRLGELLLTLSNPDVQTRALEARQRASQAQQELVSLRTSLRLQALAQEAIVAGLMTQQTAAVQARRATDSLAVGGYVSTTDAVNAAALSAEMTTRLRVERERLRLMQVAIDEQLIAQREQVAQLTAIARTQQDRLKAMEVRAPEAGVLQDLALQLGQWVAEGAPLARIVEPNRLKAVLRVAESDAPGVQIGQKVVIDTRNGLVRGLVMRKAAGAQSGVILVDVSLTSNLPAGAVPDLNVDGTVEIDVLRDVLSIPRPASANANSTMTLYRLTDRGRTGERVRVVIGRASADRVEVREGLAAGDRVILTDLADRATANRIAVR